jgi:hypothetical protein
MIFSLSVKVKRRLASVDKSIRASSELATITSDYPTKNIFHTDGSMMNEVAGFAMHNRNYETVSFRLKSLQ